MMMPATGWEDLDDPWRLALQAAWEAHTAGSIGVGAVLTDEHGRVVAQGRNRVCDATAPEGRLHRTFIAHAEIDVLGQLPPGDYQNHTIWATLEPCLLCSSAIVMSNVGHVRFGASDHLWTFLERLPQIGDFVADRWPERLGPLPGPIGSFCELLPLLWFLEHKPKGSVIARYAGSHPTLLDLARTIHDTDQLADHREEPVGAALACLHEQLLAVEPPR